MSAHQSEIEHFMKGLKKRNQNETEFHQALEEVAESVMA
ncbi:hypothetical protein HNR65_000341 [Desulfosalsimonas propionicica]|uniref:Glutamate dehydrogenase n=1 Tax=Desulfosalsimonas propionicica TaxID=332175 RepID=A0A7W0C6D2_9BACT|nr:hypothetical protein [Desulfosalsimonas propionicica]